MEKLLFIYNAGSGKANAFLDAVHKILQPSLYSCDLCRLTYGNFLEKKEWKQFRERSSVPMEFLHRDEFEKAYASKFGYKFSFPIVLLAEQENFEVFVTPEELKKMDKVGELIEIIRKRIKN